MKIIFICGSLEPGRDGVGDYIRTLGVQLCKQGVNVGAIALFDDHLTSLIDNTQFYEDIELEVLRIPSILSAKFRFEYAQTWIDKFNPEWISLQFVPFSFHKKGVPFGLIRNFSKLGKSRRWHFMFHELWVGMEIGASSKYIFWGWIQKQIIRSLINKLQPELIHTQTRLYQVQLAKLGYVAKYLPLFSNIPIIKTNFKNLRFEQIDYNIKNTFSLVIFGSIHSGVNIHQLAKEVAEYAKKNKLRTVLTIIGRNGLDQKHWANIWESEGIEVKTWGEQSPEVISKVLTDSTLGISTTPISLIEKSGTVAAMKEHGLPVLSVRCNWQARGIEKLPPTSGILEYNVGNFESCVQNLPNKVSNLNVSEIGFKLINDLSYRS